MKLKKERQQIKDLNDSDSKLPDKDDLEKSPLDDSPIKD